MATRTRPPVGRVMANRKIYKEEDVIDPAKLERLTHLGCPIYSKTVLTTDGAAKILLTDEGIQSIDQEKLCAQVPPFPPGKGRFTFLIDLTKVDPDDITYDELGKWGKPSGHRVYLKLMDDGSVKKVGQDTTVKTDYDFFMRVNRYNHPGTPDDDGKIFRKVTYVAANPDTSIFGTLAIIHYIAQFDADELTMQPHARSKDPTTPMVRTKRSILKSAERDSSNIARWRNPNRKRYNVKSRKEEQEIEEEVETMEAADNVLDFDNEMEPIPKSAKREAYTTPYISPDASARTNPFLPPPSRRYKAPSMEDALKIQVLRSEKRRNDAEVRKIEFESDKLLTEKEKLEWEVEKIKIETKKYELEIAVLKAKKYKLDLELTGHPRDIDEEGVEYAYG